MKPKKSVSIPAYLAAAFAAVLFAGAAAAETVVIPVPKSVVSTAFNTALGPMKIHVDNYGPKQGTSWLDNDSYVLTPGGSKQTFLLPEYTFPVTQWRRWKYYVSDLGTSTMQASVNGSRIHLDSFFESQGEEVKAKCIRRRLGKWGECSLDIERDIHLDNTIAAIALTPVAYNGSISYANPQVDFKTDVRIANRLCQRVSGICSAIESKIGGEVTSQIESTVQARLGSSAVRGAVASAVRNAVPFRSYIDPAWRVTDVRSSGGNFLITVERPDTIDGSSVSSLELVPKRAAMTASCPATVKFDATIKMKHTVKGTGYLRYENGGRSKTFNWSAKKGQSVTSTVSRKFHGQAGGTKNGWVRLTVRWKGSDGKTYSKTSNKAGFAVTCSRGVGGITTGR